MEELQYIEARNLQKKVQDKLILRNINIKLNRQEVVGLLGPNGAGKTTCFYVITGQLLPDKGQILANQHDITHLPMYKRARLGIGYLPQESSIFKSLTVEENIMSILEFIEPNKNKCNERLEELLQDFDISHVRNSKAIALSGGERRRLEIARTLATNPSFILLDEPLAGIDPIAISEIRSLIIKLKSKNIGVLITDHNVYEMLTIVDRAYIIYDGDVLVEGSPKEIVSDPRVQDVYLGKEFNWGKHT